MNLLERVLTLLRANLNTVVEKADDPEKVLRQLQLDMRNQLVQVKTQVATAIAEGHKLQKRSMERKVQADVWLKKAEQAVQQGNDTTAREALTHYNDMNKQIQRYQEQKKEQDQLVATMRNALRQLEVKIAEVDTTIDLLATRKRNALIQQRVFEVLNKSGSPKDKESASKAQDAVLEAEARARALADLHSRDLDTQLNRLSSEQIIEQQLRDIKLQQNPSLELPESTTKRVQTAPLRLPGDWISESIKRSETSRLAMSNQETLADEASTQRDLDLDKLKEMLDISQTPD